MKIAFSPSFLRQLKKCEPDLIDEALEKTDVFKKDQKNKSLKVHKLKGKLQNRLSFSVNYKIRIVFKYLSSEEAILLAIGDHDIYR